MTIPNRIHNFQRIFAKRGFFPLDTTHSVRWYCAVYLTFPLICVHCDDTSDGWRSIAFAKSQVRRRGVVGVLPMEKRIQLLIDSNGSIMHSWMDWIPPTPYARECDKWMGDYFAKVLLLERWDGTWIRNLFIDWHECVWANVITCQRGRRWGGTFRVISNFEFELLTQTLISNGIFT